MTEEEPAKSNNIGETLREWWNSDAFKELQEAHEKGVQQAVGKYMMLPEQDKLDMVQAICTIICNAEKEGTSHRGLMDKLGIYPSGFGISELMDVHNSLYSYYKSQRSQKES
jgi:hypothetical protein